MWLRLECVRERMRRRRLHGPSHLHQHCRRWLSDLMDVDILQRHLHAALRSSDDRSTDCRRWLSDRLRRSGCDGLHAIQHALVLERLARSL